MKTTDPSKQLSERALKLIREKQEIKKHLKSGKSIRELEERGYRFARPL